MTLSTPWRGLLAGTVVLAVLVGGWVLITDRTLDRVSVTSGDWRCAGTSLVARRVDGHRQPAPRMVPGMRCRRTLEVHNRSAWAVTLGSVEVPGLGSTGSPGVRVSRVDGRSPRPGADARVDIGQHLAADAATEVRVQVVFRADGCTALGGFRTRPAMVVSAWGRTRQLGPQLPLVFEGTLESDCLGRLPGRTAG